MLETTLTRLLSGEFICEIRYPDEWKTLGDDSARKEAVHVLNRLGLRLTRTRNGEGAAWFAAYETASPEARNGMRRVLKSVKTDLRLLVEFFVHVMQALGKDAFLAPGTLIETNKLVAEIDANPSLRADLQSVAASAKLPIGDNNVRNTLERLLKRMLEEGYLVLSNPERDIYEVTGKIEYLQSIVDFLMDHQGISDDLADEERRSFADQQGALDLGKEH